MGILNNKKVQEMLGKLIREAHDIGRENSTLDYEESIADLQQKIQSRSKQ